MRKSFTYNGKRHFVRCKDLAEFEKKKAEIIIKVDNDIQLYQKNCLVSKWADGWIDTYKSNNDLKYQKAQSKYLQMFVNKFGSYRLRDLEQRNIQMYINSYEGMSAVTIRKHIQLLRNFFETALDNNLIVRNPVKDIKLPKIKDEVRRRAITKDERDLFLKVASYHYGGLYIKIMLFCGLRTMEVAALNGNDIDLDKREIRVYKNIKYDNTIKTTKTRSGIRTVPIPEVLMEDFNQMNLHHMNPALTTPTGKRYSSSTVEIMWRSFKKCMELERGGIKLPGDLVMYNLRHTYCTDLQAAGVPINVAKELMGHSSINVTAKIYTHSSEESLEDAKNKIDSLMDYRKGKSNDKVLCNT